MVSVIVREIRRITIIIAIELHVCVFRTVFMLLQ